VAEYLKRKIVNAYDSANDRFKVDAQVVANPSNLDVALSSRASESTLSAINTKLGYAYDGENEAFSVVVKETVNPPNLNVPLASRASESTLSAISSKIIQCDTDNVKATVAPGYDSNYATGTTADDWASALDWTVVYYLHKTITIKNTGSNSMDYKVITRAVTDGSDYEETSGSLSAGDILKVVLNNHYYRVIIKVKSTTAGASTSYRIDYCGFKG